MVRCLRLAMAWPLICFVCRSSIAATTASEMRSMMLYFSPMPNGEIFEMLACNMMGSPDSMHRLTVSKRLHAG